MQAMEIAARSNAHQYATRANERRIAQAKRTAREMTKEVRMCHRSQTRFDKDKSEDLLYIQPWNR